MTVTNIDLTKKTTKKKNEKIIEKGGEVYTDLLTKVDVTEATKKITKKKAKKIPGKSERQKRGELYTDLTKVDVTEYVDNLEFYKEMVISKENGELTARAVDFFILLANKAIRSFPYSDKKDKDDCLANSYHDFIKYALKNFKPEKTNIVAYCSTLAFNGFMKGWNKLKPKKHKAIKYVVSFFGEPQYTTYDEEDANEYYENLKSYHQNNEKYVTLDSYTVSKNISMDGIMEDSETGIYNI